MGTHTWEVKAFNTLFRQLQRHGHYVKEFQCRIDVKRASPKVFARAFKCLDLCPTLTRLKIVYEEWKIYSGPGQSPEPLFKHLARQLAPRLEHFTLRTTIFALGAALPSLLDDFLAQCSNLKSLCLVLLGQEPAPGVIDLIAARVRQLPRLQDVSVPSFEYLRPTGAVVTARSIRHLRTESEIEFDGLEYIQREFGATLERLQVGGITSPEKRMPALLFPALWSLQIEHYPHHMISLSCHGLIRKHLSKFSTSG